MLHLSDALKKSYTRKHRGKQTIGAFCIAAINTFFNNQRELEGSVKFHKCFIKNAPQEAKIQIFKEKKQILTAINAKLESIGYHQPITDILFK